MKELRKETYHASHPSRITFGDPYYFESFHGDKLHSLTLDLKVPDWMDVRLVLREDLMEREDYGDDDLFARLSETELKRRALVIYLAPSKTMQTYLDGMQYQSQKVDEKQIGVDTACYLLRVDDRTETVHTAADGYWGGVETLYRVIDGTICHDAVIITVEIPEDYDFEEMRRLARYLFSDLRMLFKPDKKNRREHCDRYPHELRPKPDHPDRRTVLRVYKSCLSLLCKQVNLSLNTLPLFAA